jgi:antitoxin component YwqK of YwqJK toxin-antitoxin module
VCQETPYQNGRAEGEEKDYFESGKVQNATIYADGKLHGRIRRYDESGILRVEGAHAHGEKDGLWVRSDEKGKESARSVFEKGKRVKILSLELMN